MGREKKEIKNGFSLIELIIVLAVMAILALIAIPSFTDIRENAKIKADRLSCESIENNLSILLLDEIIQVSKIDNSVILEFDKDKKIKTINLSGLIGGQALDEAGAVEILKSAFSNVRAPQADVQILEDGSLGDVGATEKYHVWIELNGDINVRTLIKKPV